MESQAVQIQVLLDAHTQAAHEKSSSQTQQTNGNGNGNGLGLGLGLSQGNIHSSSSGQIYQSSQVEVQVPSIYSDHALWCKDNPS